MVTSTSRQRPRGVDLRSAILDAASSLLESTGSDDAVTLRAVAREVGITAPAIYTHFADRHEILRTIVESTFAELAAAMRVGGQDTDDPTAALVGVSRAYLEFAAERPRHYRVLFERHRTTAVNLTGSDTPHRDVRTMVGADAFGVLLAATTECVRTGASAATDPVWATHRIWIGLHGQATLMAALPWHPWPDRTALARDVLHLLAELTR